MTSRVLVPMDDSEMAKRALRYALEHHPDADITVMHVVGGPSSMMGAAAGLTLADDFEEAAREHAQEILDSAREIADEYGRTVSTEIELGQPTRAILRQAGDFDAVVIGSHGGTLAERLLIGNTAKKVFNRSPVPVTAVR